MANRKVHNERSSWEGVWSRVLWGFFVCAVEFRIKEALDVSVLNPSLAGEARPHVL